MGALCAISFAALFLFLPKLIKKRKQKEDFKTEFVICIAAVCGMILFGALSPEVEPMEEVPGTQQVVETETIETAE